MEYGPGIAPSVTTTPIMPDLPQITVASPLFEQQLSVDTFVNETTSTNVGPEEAPIDLPDHLPELPIAKEPIFSAPISSLPVVESKVEQEENLNLNTRPTSISMQSSDVSADARASLMEAIRQAGKKTLHSVKVEPEKTKVQVRI